MGIFTHSNTGNKHCYITTLSVGSENYQDMGKDRSTMSEGRSAGNHAKPCRLTRHVTNSGKGAVSTARANEKAMNTDQEQAYLQACLQVKLFEEGELPEVPVELDWDRFIRITDEQQVSGILAKMSRSYPDWLPREANERLLNRRYSQLLHHVDWGAVQARQVLVALAAQQIPVIVLKGWALVALVYGDDYSQRPAADIDLLISPAHAGRTIEVLESLGYTATELEPWPGYFQRFYNSRHYVSLTQDPASKQTFNVDLHWGFPDAPYYDRRISVEGLLERSKMIQVAGVVTRSLAIEDMLIYSSVHMAHHGYRATISRYFDMAVLVKQAGTGLDWAELLGRASAWRVRPPLVRMLRKIEKMWPGVLPIGVLPAVEQLRPGWRERWTDWGLREIKNFEARSILLTVLNTPGLGWRLRFILETAFPSPDYLRHYFGSAAGKLWPLLYLRRLARFLGWIRRVPSPDGNIPGADPAGK
jgi:hypothetical protein